MGQAYGFFRLQNLTKRIKESNRFPLFVGSTQITNSQLIKSLNNSGGGEIRTRVQNKELINFLHA